ncbi:MAG: winged helix-turn-helix domain-containing protein [Solirubrobacterales bacterium]|nr:winged helix-turn-helix domain-containing protein [Solirubrobacterales bacterium]MBV9714342.1 winged helix-turn-helix domain-containing protein [Solirubrobacterales bacterium]
MTRFRVLGPIEVWADEQRQVLGGRRQLALLAFLLLHANQVVSSDAIIDAVWGSDRRAPASGWGWR